MSMVVHTLPIQKVNVWRHLHAGDFVLKYAIGAITQWNIFWLFKSILNETYTNEKTQARLSTVEYYQKIAPILFLNLVQV